MNTTRPCGKQGSWYSDSQELRTDLDEFYNSAVRHSIANNDNEISELLQKQPEAAVKYLVCPHAGLVYCGAISAKGFLLFKNYPSLKEKVKTILLLGVCHSFTLDQCSQTAYDNWTDPLDNSKVLPVTPINGMPALPKSYDRAEHSAEIIVPFISDIFGEEIRAKRVAFTPLYCDGKPEDSSALAHLTKVAVDPSTLVVVSSDFCHSGRNYGYFPKMEGKTFEQTVIRIDIGAVETIVDSDREAFLEFIRSSEATICGRHTIDHMLALCKGAIGNAYLLGYTKSGPLASYRDSAVSYVSIVGFAK